MYRHLLLTRFNVKLSWLGSRKLGDDWLRHRCSIFERVTLPCVRGQTNRNFTWLIFVDSETSTAFKSRISGYCKDSLLRPVFVTGNFNLATVQSSVAPFGIGREFLITTRLDTDDGVCRTFVEVIQKHFSQQAFEFLNFTN